MFATATRNFVEEVDPDGGLIPVSSLKHSISVLSVVVKRKKFWPWQKPKYSPTDFTLNDLLTGDAPLTPGITEMEFIKYSGTYGGNIEGNVHANFGNTKVNSDVSVGGKDSSKLQSALGSLRKEELDMQKLLRDCKDRTLDMTHALVKQTKERHRQSFGIVKERITNAQPCSVIEDVQQSGQCGGGLTLCAPNNPKTLRNRNFYLPVTDVPLETVRFSLKENGSLGKDSNVTMEIPVGTTLAYVLVELEIKHDGRFELLLMSDSSGSFEVDNPRGVELMGVSGAPPDASENKHLSLSLEPINKYFPLLAALPASTRAALLQHITKVMEDPGAVASLESALEQMSLDRKPSLTEAATTDVQKENIQAILALVEQSSEGDEAKSSVKAHHLLAGALDGMTEESLFSLRTCCSPAVLPTLELLVQSVSGEGEVPLSSVSLPEDSFEEAKRLFASSNVSLERDGDTVKTEIKPQPGNLPLLLCIAVRALASLAHSE